MEIKELVNKWEIIGLVSDYNSSVKEGMVKELKVNNIVNAIKMVLLDESYLDKNIQDLTLNEQFKIDLMTKLNNDIIIVGNLSKVLNYKDIEYFKKLFLKLNNNYHKKIVIIDKDVNVFFNCVKKIIVLKNKELLYETNDFYDMELYKYVKCPKIVEFINYVNDNGHLLNKTTDIYELIKDIYRSV